jgi:hypothetical protein
VSARHLFWGDEEQKHLELPPLHGGVLLPG